jgi:hypothetical protein
MTMADWIAKLDEFLKLSNHELLDHAGKITAEQARLKAELEYSRYRAAMDAQPRKRSRVRRRRCGSCSRAHLIVRKTCCR